MYCCRSKILFMASYIVFVIMILMYSACRWNDLQEEDIKGLRLCFITENIEGFEDCKILDFILIMVYFVALIRPCSYWTSCHQVSMIEHFATDILKFNNFF